MSLRLLHGDCVERIAEMPEGSVDAVVCDPPYFLEFMGKAWDSAARSKEYAPRQGYGNKGILPFYGRGGSPSDRDAFRRRTNQEAEVFHCRWVGEVLRALVPGGTLKAFGGSRTFHRLGAAMETVGFVDIRLEAWGYGSGFPKSHNVAKAVDALVRTGRSDSLVTGTGARDRDGRHWSEFPKSRRSTDEWAPVTEEGEAWSGWGTALKPAWEPVLVGRKP